MDRQFTEYATWQQRSVLPLTRTSVRMPEALYAFALRQAGIDIPPQDLIRQAQVAYLETRMAMQALAPLDRALLLLHLEGCSHAQSGEVLGMSEGNVATRLNRIKQQLRRLTGAESTTGARQ